MLTPYSRSQFVTKILTSDSGEQFRVVFLVALVDGKIKAQVVSSESLSETTASAPVCLPVSVSKVTTTFTYTPSFVPKISLFNSLFFFDSQPTRAPAFR